MIKENLMLEAERNLVNGYKKYGSKLEQNASLNRFGENESIKQSYTMRHKRNVKDLDYGFSDDLTTPSSETETPLEQIDADTTTQESQTEPAVQLDIKDLSDATLNTTALVPNQSEVWHNNLAITIPSGMTIFLVIFGLFFVSIKLLRKKLKSRKFKLKSKEDAIASVKLNSVSKSEEIELNEMV